MGILKEGKKDFYKIKEKGILKNILDELKIWNEGIKRLFRTKEK